MRIDLYLKKSGLVKRRKVAHRLCINGNVKINKLSTKPSKSVKNGDLITIVSGSNIRKVKVLNPEEGSFQTIEN